MAKSNVKKIKNKKTHHDEKTPQGERHVGNGNSKSVAKDCAK